MAGGRRVGKQGGERALRAPRGVALRRKDRATPRPLEAAGVVGLVVAVRDDQHRSSGAQSLRRGSDASLVDDELRAGEERGMRRVRYRQQFLRQRAARKIRRVGADEQHGPQSETFDRRNAALVEGSGCTDRRRAEREDHRRRPGREEALELGRQRLRIGEEGKTDGLGVLWPVVLPWTEVR